MKKFDLHIHTVSTASDQSFDFSLENLKRYVDAARIDVIAVTNHNCFDLQQFREIQEGIGDDTFVFPGIEVNIGQNAGHLILIADPSEAEDFSNRCSQVETEITSPTDTVTVERVQEIFQDLSKYLLIPHYEKAPAVDKRILSNLKEHFFCGEVSSVKKFIYCQKDPYALTPVYFSDWRATEDNVYPSRHTWIDVNDYSISAIKLALTDKSKVQLSDDETHEVFQVLPDLKISTGLTVIMGGRSSGKSYTLDRINDAYDNVKYIRQFSLLEIDPDKSKEQFTKGIAAKRSSAMRDYFSQFAKVVDEIAEISLSEDEADVDNYLKSLLKHASEVDRADMFSRCKLYSESEYSIDSLDGLKELISSVERLLDTRKYKDVIEKNIDRSSLIKLHGDLIQKYIEEKQLSLKKTWINDVVNNIKRSLQRRTADTRVANLDFYRIQMNRKKVERFCNIVELLKQPAVIDEQEIEGFTIQVSKRPYSGAQELKAQSGKKIAFNDVVDDYNNNPYAFLLGIEGKQAIEGKDYYQYFAKIEYKILNQYGFEVSGGERAEFNLLQEISDAHQYDMLLIDEPESSFDNIFLRDKVNHIIKEISTKMPVVIVTHNNTVGASIKPDYIVHTRREIIDRTAVFEIYYGFPGCKTLRNEDEKEIANIEVTMDCLEAGQSAYEERQRDYEMLRN